MDCHVAARLVMTEFSPPGETKAAPGNKEFLSYLSNHEHKYRYTVSGAAAQSLFLLCANESLFHQELIPKSAVEPALMIGKAPLP
ncbi:MAG: hypothetical protein LBE06_09590 [Azoarcus sp.]|jgi:hypothetical protein|nr:hypothetical protein [Azoarcus sp.]